MKKLLILLFSLISFIGYSQTVLDPGLSPTTTRVNTALQEAIVLSGTDTYTATKAGVSYTSGYAYDFTFQNGNTGTSPTINLDPGTGALGAKSIRKYSAGSLVNVAANDLKGTMRLRYDGTFFVLDGIGNIGSGAGAGTVTNVSVTTANGISGSVTNPTTTPAISLTLGSITPTTVNGVTISGSSTPSIAVTGTTTISGTHAGTSSGTNTGDQTSVTGNAGTATALQTARTINGTSFDGTGNITVFSTPLTANTQAGNYTLVLTDANDKIIYLTSNSANALTVPPNSSVAFPIGTKIYLRSTGTGTTTYTQGSGVTITSSSGSLVGPGQNILAVLIKTGTDTWTLDNGTILTSGGLLSTIGNGNILYQYIQNVSDGKILGNATGGVSAPSEITPSNGLTIASSTLKLGGALTATTALSGAFDFQFGNQKIDNTFGLTASSGSTNLDNWSSSGTINTTASYSGGTARGFHYHPTITSTIGLTETPLDILGGNIASSGTTNYTGLNIHPTINTTGTHSGGTFTGIDVNPTFTASTGLATYAALFRNGKVVIGTPNFLESASLTITGQGTTGSTSNIRTRNGSNTTLTVMYDDGTFEFNYQGAGAGSRTLGFLSLGTFSPSSGSVAATGLSMIGTMNTTSTYVGTIKGYEFAPTITSTVGATVTPFRGATGLVAGTSTSNYNGVELLPTFNLTSSHSGGTAIAFNYHPTETSLTGLIHQGIIINSSTAFSGFGTSSPNSMVSTTSFSTGYVAKTGSYTLTSADHTVEVTSGTNTQTLPTAVGIPGRIYVVTNSGSGTVTVGTTSSQTFVNVTATPTTLTLAQFVTAVVQSNGANWLKIN